MTSSLALYAQSLLADYSQSRVEADLLELWPEWLQPTFDVVIEKGGVRAVFRVAPDYAGVELDDGSFMRLPARPETYQRVADAKGFVLPTPELVDAIAKYHAAVYSKPITQSTGQRVQGFLDHNAAIERALGPHPSRAVLRVGPKKDVVLIPEIPLKDYPELGDAMRVVIHGWHYPGGRKLIQGTFKRHVHTYLDYSHGWRPVAREVCITFQGREEIIDYEALLTHPIYAPILFGRVFLTTRYPT